MHNHLCSLFYQVREHPLYHLIKARIHRKKGELKEAAKTLETALALPGVKRMSDAQSDKRKKVTTELSVRDRVSVFLELAEAYRLLDQQVCLSTIIHTF